MAESTETHCPYCALQCAMTLERDSAGEVRARPAGGGLCRKGWTAPELLAHPDRLTSPLVKGRKATWDEALDHIAERHREITALSGRDSVGVYGSGALTNEKAYQLGKFARLALGTPYIDYNGRFCMSSAAAAANRSLGIDRGLPFPMADLAEADTVLLAGANPAETMPPFMRHLAGPDLIVADPRLTGTAEQALLHLPVRPGTDAALAAGLLHIAIAESRTDRDYIDARTTGFDAVARSVSECWPAWTERVTGIPVADLYRAVELMAGKRTAILTARGSEQHSQGVDTVTAWINLALALGLVGRPSSGYGCLTGQGNGQGGREHGQKADQLPGYRSITDPDARRHVADVWGVSERDLPGPGVSATELLSLCGGDIRSLFVFGSNPAVSAPRSARVAENLAALDLLVVCDFFLSETAELAEVVLPTAQWAEEDGTMTNLEGRLLRRRMLTDPPRGVRTDLRIMADLAERLGGKGSFATDPEEVFEELRRASEGGRADYSGATWDRIDAERLHWPVRARSRERAKSRERMFTDLRFPTDDGRARFVPVSHRETTDVRDAGTQLWLTTGRVLTQYQSGTQTRRVGSLAGEPYLALHPDTAENLGIGEGERVRVRSDRGWFEAPAKLDWTLRRDVVFSPFHYGGAANVNRVVSDALDPLSRMPEFKVSAVRLERATGA
ncbi:molybdopterin oxidoreductase family protein [Salininema proteolyticum]|uniref:Molybdopterin oxidoreductase family protein n=1 Tax=Salininema proteolyticum TaxID=1607685 RepID=A0ABV8U4N7_9ACTN